MKRPNILQMGRLLVSLVVMCHYANAQDELVIKYIGKMDVASTNGSEQLDVFYMTNKTSDWKVFGLYWFAKTNSHQALATDYTNSVVDWGDNMCCFHVRITELLMFPGFTNVADPFSEGEIRKYCEPIFKPRIAGEAFPGVKRLMVESVVPKFSLGPVPRSHGFHFIITKTSVTTTNVTLEVNGVQTEDHDRIDPKDNLGKFTFGKDLNLLEARIITNTPPSTIKQRFKFQ